MVESQLLLREVTVGDSQLDRLVACFKALSLEGRQTLLAEAERLERRERTTAILQYVAKQKQGNRGDDVEMDFEDLLTFVRALPVDESHAARIWKALAIRAGRIKDVKKKSDPLPEVKAFRFKVGFIHQNVRKAARFGPSYLGNSVGPEVFELLEGWDKTL